MSGKTEARVRLLRYTPDPEGAVALGARLCYSPSGLDELGEKLSQADKAKYIQRLVDMGHVSPLEHASFTFGLEGVSRALLAQITRHRLASFSVQSQRYVSKKNDDVFDYIIPPAIERLGGEAVAEYGQQMRTMQNWYNDWLDRLGNAGESSNEDARFVLPNACETKMLLTMNARELLHFFGLRCCNRAQWEIRGVAWSMLELCRKAAPAIFRTAGPACVAGQCPEGNMTCGRAEEVRRRHGGMQ